MLDPSYVMNLRDVFCGDGAQHETVVASAAHFLTQRKEPGIFVVGGTNLTGKTSLVRKIGEIDGFRECISLKGDRNPPQNDLGCGDRLNLATLNVRNLKK